MSAMADPVLRIQLVHWHAAEAEERAGRLRAAGHEVRCEVPDGMAFLRRLRVAPPDAVVIDLGRLPMQGRDVALGLRQALPTRRVPLVFVGGLPEKVARVRRILPDATYTPWAGIRAALRRAVARPRRDPVVPASVLAGYSGTPLVRKLGIKPGSVVGFVAAPPGFETTLGALPDGVQLRSGARGRCDLVLAFVRSRADLAHRLEQLAGRRDIGSLWILWPKKAPGVANDVSQREVRAAGLAAGLVDFKIAAIDAVWSGLRFVRRKPR